MLGLGAMALMPSTPDGCLVPLAYAEGEDGLFAQSDPQFTFKVVAPDEVGFHVVDVAHPDSQGNYPPVVGMEITLTLNDEDAKEANKKSVSGITESDGSVLISIDDLVKRGEDGKLKTATYQCYAELSMKTTDNAPVKMRDFSTGRMFFMGQTAQVIGAHAYTEGELYIERLTFNDADVHYSEGEWLRAAANDVDHAFLVRIKGNVSGDVPSKLNVYMASDKTRATKMIDEVTSKAILINHDGYTVVSFTDKFLHVDDNNKRCLPEGNLVVTFDFDVGSSMTLSTDIRMSVKNAPLEATKYTGQLMPFPSSSSSLFSFETSWKSPVFNGVDISFVAPWFPFRCYMTPIMVILGFGLDLDLLDSDKGAIPWGRTAGDIYGHWKGVYQNQCNSISTAMRSLRQPYLNPDWNPDDPNSSCRTNKKAMGFAGVTFIIQAIASINIEDNKTNPSGNVMLRLGVSASGTFTVQFTLGPVPMFASFSLGFSIVFNATFEHEGVPTSIQPVLDVNDIRMRSANINTLTMTPTINVSVGAGLSGVASICVSATLSFPQSFIWGEAGREGKAEPHVMHSVVIKFELVIQFLFFKASFNIWSYSETSSDNTLELEPAAAADGALDGSWGEGGPRFLLTHADGTKRHTVTMSQSEMRAASIEDFIDDLVVVDDNTLEHTKEAVARLAMKAQEEGGPTSSKRVHAYKEPIVMLDDEGNIVVELRDSPTAHTLEFGANPQGEVFEAQDSEALESGVGLDMQAFDSDFLASAFGGLEQEVTKVYDYDYVDGKTTYAPCTMGGVNGISDDDGIIPTADTTIYEGVYSNARHRIVEIGGQTWLFRIVSVEYPLGDTTVKRNRLAASCLDTTSMTWGKPTVLEYASTDSSVWRAMMHDYDFDLVTCPDGEQWVSDAKAAIVVVGGLRQSDSVVDALANQTVSTLLVNDQMQVVRCNTRRASALHNDPSDTKAYAVDMVRIVDGFAPHNASGVYGIVFVLRSADVAGNLLGDQAVYSFALGYFFARESYLSFSIKWNDKGSPNGWVLGSTIRDVICTSGGSTSSSAVLKVVFVKDGGYEAWSAVMLSGQVFDDVTVRRNVLSTQPVPALQPWPGRGTFLFTKHRPDNPDESTDYHLYAGDFDPLGGVDLEGLSETVVDSGAVKIATFVPSPSGNYIFAFESFRAPANSANGLHDTYRIMACRYVDRSFTEEFPFANLSHTIDQLQVLAANQGNASVFLTLEITDADKSEGKINYLSVPHCLAAEAEAFAPDQYFAFPGKTCTFQVDVRNHGNMIIGGFDVEMYKIGDDGKTETYVGTAHVNQIDPNKIVLNATNSDWATVAKHASTSANGDPLEAMAEVEGSLALSEAAQNGQLMPGQLMSYMVDFDIPSGWKDKVTVGIRIAKAWAYGINAMSDTDIVEHYHEGVVDTVFIDCDASGTNSVYDPEERIQWGGTGGSSGGGQWSGSSNSSGVGSNGGSGGIKRRLPDTGDTLGVARPVGLALGGVGSALMAYSTRRAQVEREQRERQEDSES